MVAPGLQLEFEEGPSFERVGNLIPGLAAAVRERYSNHPQKMIVCSEFLKKGDLQFGETAYEFLIYRRGPTKVFLLTIAAIKNGKGIPKADLERFIKLFKS